MAALHRGSGDVRCRGGRDGNQRGIFLEQPEGSRGWSVVGRGERGQRGRGRWRQAGGQTASVGHDDELDICSNCKGLDLRQANGLMKFTL